MTTHKKSFKAYIPTLIGVVVLLVSIFLIVKFIGNMEDKPEKKEKKIQPITVLKPPPPPPPPPKVEQPPPPEEKMEQVEPEAEPEPEPLPDVAEPPPGDLGLDAEGGAGSDSFGLVGRKGGKGLLGGGEGGNPFAWYHGIIKNEVQELLSEKDELRKKGFTAIVDIWIEPDGTVKRIEVAKGSNDPEIDALLTKVLGKLKKFNEQPPAGMEQPVKLRIKDTI